MKTRPTRAKTNDELIAEAQAHLSAAAEKLAWAEYAVKMATRELERLKRGTRTAP